MRKATLRRGGTFLWVFCVVAALVAADWRNLGGDAQHSSYTPVAFQRHFKFVKSVDVAPYLSGLFASPVVVRDVVYSISARRGALTAYSLAGKKILWQTNLDDTKVLLEKGLAASDTTLFIPSGVTGKMIGVNLADARVAWSFTVGATLTSPLFFNGNVYFADQNGSVYALTEGGKLVWKADLNEPIAPFSMAPAAYGEKVYIGTTRGTVAALDAATGKTLWKYAAAGQIDVPPVVFPEIGVAIMAKSADKAHFLFLSDAGAETWSYEMQSVEGDRPGMMGTDGSLIFALIGSKVYSFNLDGSFLWKQDLSGLATGLLVSKDTLVVGTQREEGKTLNFLSKANGDVLHSHHGEGWFAANPVAAGDWIIAPNEDGRLYLFTIK
ncbi:MAG: PQQ-binding-like beta-propeller repeat protein [bacterium]